MRRLDYKYCGVILTLQDLNRDSHTWGDDDPTINRHAVLCTSYFNGVGER